jgi:uncharacterized membrane protein (UPF0127 family)
MRDGDILFFSGVRGNPPFKTEVALSEPKKKQGLMYRDGLPRHTGMFFLNTDESKRRSMWMPNMRFPLDIVWLDGTLKIVSIRYNCEPCISLDDCPSISSIKKCQHAIEFAAGEVKALGLREGDRLKLA